MRYNAGHILLGIFLPRTENWNMNQLTIISKVLNFQLIKHTAYFGFLKFLLFSPILAYYNRFLKSPIERKLFS
jgi:hypothetical protein